MWTHVKQLMDTYLLVSSLTKLPFRLDGNLIHSITLHILLFMHAKVFMFLKWYLEATTVGSSYFFRYQYEQTPYWTFYAITYCDDCVHDFRPILLFFIPMCSWKCKPLQYVYVKVIEKGIWMELALNKEYPISCFFRQDPFIAIKCVR